MSLLGTEHRIKSCGPRTEDPRTEDPGQRTQVRGARTEDPEHRSQDRGPRTEHLGQNDRESRSKDMIEDCRSRTLDESKPWMITFIR